MGDTAAGLSGKSPGATLASALAAPVGLPDGGKDLHIQRDKFLDQFAADPPEADARLMAAGQRPVTVGALSEAATDPAWKSLPSYFAYGSKDKTSLHK